MKKPYYFIWWCEVHRRRATHWLVREGMEDEPHCDPGLGGIMLPCKAVKVYSTDEVRSTTPITRRFEAWGNGE
jgi:hypothetical protein